MLYDYLSTDDSVPTLKTQVLRTAIVSCRELAQRPSLNKRDGYTYASLMTDGGIRTFYGAADSVALAYVPTWLRDYIAVVRVSDGVVIYQQRTLADALRSFGRTLYRTSSSATTRAIMPTTFAMFERDAQTKELTRACPLGALYLARSGWSQALPDALSVYEMLRSTFGVLRCSFRPYVRRLTTRPIVPDDIPITLYNLIERLNDDKFLSRDEIGRWIELNAQRLEEACYEIQPRSERDRSIRLDEFRVPR